MITHEKDGLLSNTSRAELEKELINRLRPILDRTKGFAIGEPEGYAADDDVEQFVRDALKELEATKKTQSDTKDS